jgi:hypothetical protein
MPSSSRIWLASLTAALLLAQPSFAFNTPLSDQAVREAYFLGQRHDESMARLLSRYTKLLPAPTAGPHITSVTFLTPFALLVQHSSQQSNYSAQQAAKDHHPDDEIVVIEIQVLLTPSYSAVIPTPTSSRSGSPIGYQFRPSDFWKDFDTTVFDGKKELLGGIATGEPTYVCDDGCVISGATIRLEFPASAFTSDSATIEVTPPEGDPVSVDFDLSSLR